MLCCLNMKIDKNITGNRTISEDYIDDLEKIGFVIRELRFNHGLLTQKELAEACGVHFNTIRSIELGNRNYNILSLMKIISFFDYEEISTFFKDFG